MSASVAERLGRPGLTPIVDELTRRYAQGDAPGSLTLRELSIGQRQALADLLGSPRLPPATSQLRLSRLTRVLGTDDAGVRAAVEILRGPIEDRRQAGAAAAEQRRSLWEWLDAETARGPAARRRSCDPGDVVRGRRRAGVPAGDVDAHRHRLAGVLRVLHRLPTDTIALANLAADELDGDAHALDLHRRLATLTLEAIALALGRPRPSDAESARLLWEEVGVVPDPISSTVTVLGLASDGDSQLDAWLRSSAAASEPVAITLAQLRRWPPPPLPGDAIVYVVENPALLTEAAGRGWQGPPLVCSSGRPSIPVVVLLRLLAAAGATLRQHADLDVAGLDISSWLAERAGTSPWKMDEADYRGALSKSRSATKITRPVPDTPWDPSLQFAMESAALAVYEEEIRGELLSAMTS